MPLLRFIFCGVIFLLMSRCHTTHNSTTPIPSPLHGSWTYVSSNGGITGKMPAWPENSKVTFKFTADGLFIKEQNGTTEKDKYAVAPGKDLLTGEMAEIIDYENHLDQVYRIQHDTLYLTDQANDGFSYVFRKK